MINELEMNGRGGVGSGLNVAKIIFALTFFFERAFGFHFFCFFFSLHWVAFAH